MTTYAEQLQTLAMLYVPKILLAVLTLIVGFWVIGWIGRLLTSVLRHRHIDETVVPFLHSIVDVLLKVVLLVSVAGIFGIETTSFVALLGGATVAIGLALQGNLSHFASGVMLLIFKPYRVGDLVAVAGFTGEVEAVKVFNTVLKTVDNKRVIIPNGAITSGPITNISGQGTIRVDMQFNVAATEGIDKVRKAVQEVVNKCPYASTTQSADILVNSLEIGYIKFDVRVWCNSAHYWDTYYFVQENIKRQFDQQGIKGPKPAMDLTMFQTALV